MPLAKQPDFLSVEEFLVRNSWRPENYYLGQSITFESVSATLAVEDIYHKVNNGDVHKWKVDSN